MKKIKVHVDVGEEVKKTVCHGANSIRSGYLEEHILTVQMIHITAGSPINGNRRMIRYTCFNRTTHEFEELSDTEMKKILKWSKK